jgi:hypothetical protein
MVKILVVPATPRTNLTSSEVNDKSGSVDPFLGPDCTQSLYICEIATHDSLSLPLRLRRLSLVVTSADLPAASDTAPLPFYLLLLPSSEETESDSLCPGGSWSTVPVM